MTNEEFIAINSALYIVRSWYRPIWVDVYSHNFAGQFYWNVNWLCNIEVVKMARLIMLVGPVASGKTTFANDFIAKNPDTVWVNQDSQTKIGHLKILNEAARKGKDIILDRMNFNRDQRNRYLEVVKLNGYETEIHVFHVPYAVCLARAIDRKDHETIKDEETAVRALRFFFRSYERVEDHEADKVVRYYVDEEPKRLAVYSDLDGTLCLSDHRKHHVSGEGQKKNWAAFFDGMSEDPVNQPIMDILNKFKDTHEIVYCTGRPDDYRYETSEWLDKNNAPMGRLYMRLEGDFRRDDIVKEILLDFEILPRFQVAFCLDDRNQVVNMLRKRGLTVLQVAEGDF